MDTCILCNLADGKVKMTPMGPRHLGLDGCVIALKQDRENLLGVITSLEEAGGSLETPPDAAWVRSWYQELRLAKTLITGKVQGLGEQLDRLNKELAETNSYLGAVDRLIANLLAGAEMQEKYQLQAQEEADQAGQAGQAKQAETENSVGTLSNG